MRQSSFLRFTPLILSITGGLLLWASWPVSPFTYLIFLAWIPLLWIERNVKSNRKFLGLAYINMFIWNITTTWWIINASLPGALAAFFANSFLMCIPWLLYRVASRKIGPPGSYLALIVFWMAFEYLHLQDWGLSWPWLTVGNVFATHPAWVQWYEYTGTSGGTLWVLVVNILLFLQLKELLHWPRKTSYRNLVFAITFLALPIIISAVMDPQKPAIETGKNIVVVQPNIDPYEKISAGTFEKQLNTLIHLSERVIDSNTVLLVWPETALYTPEGIDEINMRHDPRLVVLWDYLQRHPDVFLFSGIESFSIYNSRKTKTARPTEGSGGTFYDAYNGSALMDSSGPLQFYHKSMLVPGVETLPWFLRFIDKWFEKFGGTTAGYAKQKERTVLEVPESGYRLAPAICYESIYGEYMSKYVRNGANVIAIITNDGWWDDTPGYKQHMNYARLRAIETRKWVVRSANTGISCFINLNGTVLEAQPWNTASSIKMSIPTNNYKTYFVRNGDMLSKIATVTAGIMVVLLIVVGIRAVKR